MYQIHQLFFHSRIRKDTGFQLNIQFHTRLQPFFHQFKHFTHGQNGLTWSLICIDMKPFQLRQRIIFHIANSFRCPVHALIMDNNQFSVSGHLNIQFNPFQILNFHGFFKSNLCIFRISLTASPVCPYLHILCSPSLFQNVS